MNLNDLIAAQQASMSKSTNAAKERGDGEVVVTKILSCPDGKTKNGDQPRFGIMIQGQERPIFGFKSVVRGTLPDYVPAAGIKANITLTKNGEYVNLTSLAFKFVEDNKYSELMAKVTALKGSGLAVAL